MNSAESCAEQREQKQEQEQGINAAVLVCADWNWDSILVMAVRHGHARLEALGGPGDFQRIRETVRSWGLLPRIEETALARLDRLECDYRDWRAWKRRQPKSRVNWAFVAVMLSALVFWPLAIYGAWKFFGG